MIVEKKVSIQGEWVKVGEDIKDGDNINIIDGGKIVESEYGPRHAFNIKIKNGEIKLLSFNQTTMNNMIDAFGGETEDWKGRTVKVWVIKSNVAGKMRNVVYLTAPNWIMGDDGFYPPGGEAIEEIEY